MGDYNSTMGCGGSEEEGAQEVHHEEAPAEEPVADESDDEEGDFNVSVGIRVIKEDGESKLFLLGFDVGPQEKDIETLIPTWTPAWDSFKMDRKLKKSLKHSKN